MAWPWLALACRALALACLGIGIAPFKAFRESEAIGSLAWRGLGLLWHVVPWHWHGVALHALALTCLALRWHVVLGLGVPWPWHALPWPWHALPCVGMRLGMPCLALACLALAWPWHCKAFRE